MVKHVVMFQLSGSEAERRDIATRFCEALSALPAIVPQLISMEAGVNTNPAEQWDVTLIATAESLDDIAAYSAHQAHLDAVKIIAPYKNNRACVDYVTD